MYEKARLPEFVAQNSLSAPTQVFQECWSGLSPPPPHENEKLDTSWHLGFELGWSIHPPTYAGAGVWRLIAVFPKHTISFVIFIATHRL